VDIVALALKYRKDLEWNHTATHCNTLQHSATHCNTLQHTATQYVDIVALALKYRKDLEWEHTNPGELAAFVSYCQA